MVSPPFARSFSDGIFMDVAAECKLGINTFGFSVTGVSLTLATGCGSATGVLAVIYSVGSSVKTGVGFVAGTDTGWITPVGASGFFFVALRARALH
jgi:hypothetical protein